MLGSTTFTMAPQVPEQQFLTPCMVPTAWSVIQLTHSMEIGYFNSSDY